MRLLLLLLGLLFTGVAGANERCRLVNIVIAEQGLMQWEYIVKSTEPDKYNRNLALVEAAIDPLVAHPAVAELKEIVETPSTPAIGDVKQRLKAWAKKHAIGFEPVFPDEITQLGNKYMDQGQLTWRQTRVEKFNALIPPEFYNLMLSEGKWPIVDAHDLVSHLPDLLDPKFASLISQKTKLYNEVHALAAYSPSPQVRAGSLQIENHLYFVLRPETWEGNSFLHKTEDGKSHLVLHGNAAYRVVDSIMYNSPTQLVAGLSRVIIPAHNDLHQLPRFNEYLAARPKAYVEMEAAGEKLAVRDPAHLQIKAKLTAIEAKIRVEVTGLGPQEHATKVFMDRLAVEMDADPQLRAVFQRANRVDFLEKGLAFERDYMEWLKLNGR